MEGGIDQTEGNQQVETTATESPLVEPVDGPNKDVRGYLLRELQSTSRQIKKTFWFGAASVLIILAYSIWVYSALVGDLLNPDTLSTLIVSEVEIQAPVVLENLRLETEAQIPGIIADLKKKVFSETKAVRFAVDTHVEAVLEVMPVLRQEMEEGFQVYFDENREELAAFAETHSDEQFVDYFVSEIGSEIASQVEQAFERHSEIKTDSLAQLTMFNSEISSIASKNRFRMSEHEQLKRRVYASWLRVLETYLEISESDLSKLAAGS